MARTRPKDRLNNIGDAALAAFSDKGFRQTQVADVAKLAGLAPGTLYLSASGKEDLFWLALRRAGGQDIEEGQTPELSFDTLRAAFSSSDSLHCLMGFIEGPRLAPPPLQSIVSELYETVEIGAPTIRLIERCGADWPELAAIFYSGIRARLVENLATYLIFAAKAGICRPVDNPEIAARLILETISWFAMHRKGDPEKRQMDDLKCRETVVDALVHAYAIPLENK